MKLSETRAARFIGRNWDETVILAALAKVAFQPDAALTYEDEMIVQAFQRSTLELEGASSAEIGAYLRGLDDDQLAGAVNNVKGIAHEILFVEYENADGDTVEAIQFPATNHADTDVMLHDTATGEVWEVQLKATDSASYVQDWVDAHPDGEVIVTAELAEKMDLPTSEIGNGALTAHVEDLADRLMENETLWDLFPLMSLATLAPVIYVLVRSYRQGKIDRQQLVAMLARATGWKLAKVTVLTALLAIPGLNVAVAAGLIAKMLLCGQETFSRWEDKRALARATASPRRSSVSLRRNP